MSEVTELRGAMVDRLLREKVFTGGGLVERALREVPRHRFVPLVSPELAYADEAVVTRTGPDGLPSSSCSQPSVVAAMLDQLGVAPGDRVLEIGAGTGYNAALLARMVGPSGRVIAVDLDEQVAGQAGANLAGAGVDGVTVVCADGWEGHPAGAPYDRIIASVGVWDVSPAWVAQLDVCGVLVVPLWLRAGLQVSVALRRDREGLRSMSLRPCGFMRLRGLGAGPEGYLAGAGWSVGLDDPRPEVAAALGRLLALRPVCRAVPRLPSGWFAGVALATPEAVQLTLGEDGRDAVWAPGLLDPQWEGLAVVVDGELRCYGAPEVGEHLVELARGVDPVPLESMGVDVLPGQVAEAGPDAVAVLRRPHSTVVVRRR